MNKHGYFAVIYKNDGCYSENQKLSFIIDSTGIIKTNECFVSSNIITKHHFFVKNGNDVIEIGFKGNGYKRDNGSLYVLGVLSSGTEDWDFMIYKLGTIEELSDPISMENEEFSEFFNKCISVVNR